MKLPSVLSVLKRKAVWIIPGFLALAAYTVHHAEAQKAGITGRTTIGCRGPACHSPQPSASTVVTFLPPTTPIIAGKTYTFQLSVKNPTTTQNSAGCDISTDSGTLAAIAGSGLWLDDQFTGDLTHSSPKSFGTTDSAVWSFKYTAPDHATTDTLRAAGNAANGDLQNDGDMWNLTQYTVHVLAGNGAVAESAVAAPLIQLYPNPSNGHITLAGSNFRGHAALKVTDAAGKWISSQNIDLDKDAQLDLSAFPNGSYFVRILDGVHSPSVRSIEIKK